MLSIIIPAHKEQHLKKTVEDLLSKAEGEIEIIAVLDGAGGELPPDPRVHAIMFGRTRGMRAAINAGVEGARGEFLMKIDAHCVVAQGYDTVLTADCEDGMVMIPRRYKLDTEKWEVMPDPPTDYDKLIIMENPHKFHGEEWRSRAKKRKDIMIDETMMFQGSCWVMRRSHWDRIIRRLEEKGYGPFVQEPMEIGMKTWAAGGRIVVNKKTWYAHKHRKFNRSHHVTREEADAGNAHALKVWMKQYELLRARFGI